jgi:serine protease
MRVRVWATLGAAVLGVAGIRADGGGMRFATMGRIQPGEPRHGDGEVIVALKPGVADDAAERVIREGGGTGGRKGLYARRWLVTLDRTTSVAQALARFRALPEVDYTEVNGRARAFFTPNDPGYRFQWNLRQIGAARTWDIQRGDASVVVAVVDTGVAFEDFGPFRKAPDWGATRFVRGFNVFTGDEHANDDEGHGTNVASIVAEGTNNNEGYAGFAFDCALMPVKALDATGSGFFFQIADGVDFAVANGAKVVNLSLGGDVESETMRRSVDSAVAAGVVVVAAAGNESAGSLSFPASLPNVIAVGATDTRKQLTWYSNFGSALDVVAPGGDFDRDDDGDGVPDGILQQNLDPDFLRIGRFDVFTYDLLYQGTSQATPHVAALAALLIRQGIRDPRAVQAAIESTAEDLGTPGRDDVYGHGLIRPDRALTGLGLDQ